MWFNPVVASLFGTARLYERANFWDAENHFQFNIDRKHGWNWLLRSLPQFSSKVVLHLNRFSFKGALRSLGEDILIRREISSLADYFLCLNKQTLFVFMTEHTK